MTYFSPRYAAVKRKQSAPPPKPGDKIGEYRVHDKDGEFVSMGEIICAGPDTERYEPLPVLRNGDSLQTYKGGVYTMRVRDTAFGPARS